MISFSLSADGAAFSSGLSGAKAPAVVESCLQHLNLREIERGTCRWSEKKNKWLERLVKGNKLQSQVMLVITFEFLSVVIN